VTQILARLLNATAAGTLSPSEFAYVRAGFFPGAANYYRDMLKGLGSPTRVTYMGRHDIGDDRDYLYEVSYGSKIFMVSLNLAPDNRVAGFGISPKRE